MSNGLGIAAVTRVLQALLQSGLGAVDGLAAAIGGGVSVSALPPDRVRPDSSSAETTRLNLFLHQLAPSPAWANARLPERDARGAPTAQPLLALDLSYLLSAYAAEELQGEILLGHAVQILHENALLARERVREILANPPGGGSTPTAWTALRNADLAEQVEQVRLTPRPLGTDELSKLWTAFQSNLRPSIAYQASVVLLERRRPVRAALPVLTRGAPDPETGRDAGIVAQPSLAATFPLLLAVEPAGGRPAARLGEVLTLRGAALAGDVVTVELQPETGPPLELTPDSATAAEVRATLPPGPGEWRAGTLRVSLRITRGARVMQTNALPLMLAPRIVSVVAAAEAGGSVRLDVVASPPVRPGQAAALIVGQALLPHAPVTAAPRSDLVFRSAALPAGATLPVRLRVDGAESVLVDTAATPPRFDPSQMVTLP